MLVMQENKVRRMDSCPLKWKVSPFLDEMLPEPERQQMQQHVEHCSICAAELGYFQRIQEAAKMMVTPAPADTYWGHSRERVLSRIKLRPERSRLDHMIAAIWQIWQGRSWQLGLVTGFALVAMILWLLSGESEPLDVLDGRTLLPQDQASTLVDSEPSRADQQVELAELKASKESAVKKRQEVTPPALAQTEPLTAKNEPRPIIKSPQNNSILALHPRALTFPVIELNSGIRYIYPVAPRRFMVAEDEEKSSAGVNTGVSIFAREASGKSRRSSRERTSARELPEGASDFEQTSWIVQYSNSLEEKRNIWLSYMAREEDVTYRALAIYNLAKVLADIASASEGLEEGREAVEFFEEYEPVLRALLKDVVFEKKLTDLKRMIEK